MTQTPTKPLTRMLEAAGAGDAQAAADILPLIYDELHRLARSRMAKLPPGQTLQPTALVNEAYLRLVGGDDLGWENRGHFFFAAARAMHDILVEQARRKATLKRGGDRHRVDVDHLHVAIDVPADDILALHAALAELEREDPRGHRIVLLRFFGGLTEEQVADILCISVRTVRRDWRYLRVMLHKRLTEETDEPGGDRIPVD